ncbi:GLPGLI family protein [Riemerella anatipestifer]|uniref:GLPGLI family protein n=1 Tax=Riemerella anatipestifer TaxID=34085 RepID=UPI00129ECABB|nr:GLPGLI family protein [Riemerella anatipestifer]MBT0551127.1 GLPGLI family protein [Riemerella anatipestifer]MBT0553742.1 GLPGLI family protein [Riemerella anatipestifer]MCE3023915.1 GLPGLI family protein [Riemerella anatipestifer]MCU7542327.1 GLPGLI family protein [Riemerella anatipestifer]MCU7559688.1 GLPGLI family protein [Riemerella anatipestifer]
MLKKNILAPLFFLLFVCIGAQVYKSDSLRGSFTYLLKSKPNHLYPENIYQELFSLQVSDNRSFFISENLLKYDSIFTSEMNTAIRSGSKSINFSGKSFPKTNSKFLVVQENDKTIFYGTVGTSVLSYQDPKINSWKLVDETKIVNSFSCKKAELRFKGRDWIAWYSTEIPFPYGPYKFGGLPGLIIKMTDKKDEYDFELVKSLPSRDLKGKIVGINKKRYDNSISVTKQELEVAKDNFRKNLLQSMKNDGVVLSPEQTTALREKQKRDESEKKGYNPIELED